MIHQAKTLLKTIFGYDAFRPLQQEVIEHVLTRKDTLVIMPTGGGKSLCYQIPALIFDGLTVVVSPLISLMKDQVEQLTALGIPALVLNSSLSPEAYRQNVARVARNEVKLLYLAPETLLMPRTFALLASQRVDALVIDEAHCISEWGHDFRPEYRQLIEGRTRFPQAVCMALTATATPRVQQDIKECLRFTDSDTFLASFNRENLFLQIRQKTQPMRQTMDFLAQFPNQSGIIYCATRQQVEDVADALARQHLSVKPYHAGLDDAARQRNQEAFIRDDAQIMVATVAFGMGINKPNVRFILHYDLPQNIESYYQQIGRAGRDGENAHCLLLFGYADLQKIRYFISQKDAQEQRIATMHLNAMIGFAESGECRRVPLLSYFGEHSAAPKCGMCDNCVAPERELADVTIPAQKFLSCVKRTGEMFGAGHVIDVLRGSEAEKVLKFGHQRLSTYGIGLEYSKPQWSYLSRQFLQKGLLEQDAEHGSLKLTAKAWEVMRGKEQVFAALEERQDAPARGGAEAAPPCDQALFELLRQKRKELADAANVPPYVIFPDKTLTEMAAFFPQTEERLREIYGVGAVKFERYGAQFLAWIGEYCQAHQLEEQAKPARSLSDAPLDSGAKKRRHLVVGEAYNAGTPLPDIAAEYNVKLSTILNHLFTCLSEGYALKQGDDLLAHSTVSAEQRAAALDAFDRLGAERLKPVFEDLREAVSYDELHLLRLYYLLRQQTG